MIKEYDYEYPKITISDKENVSFIFKEISLAGAYYYMGELKKFCRDKNGTKTFYPMYEPANPYDKNAIVIKSGFFGVLGYVPRYIASQISLLKKKDKESLYIQPVSKSYYIWDDRSSNATFVFNIVKIKDFSRLSEEEKKLFIKIRKQNCGEYDFPSKNLSEFKSTFLFLAIIGIVLLYVIWLVGYQQ